MALAAFRNAIFSLLLPFGTLLETTFPPLTFLLGASGSQEAQCLAVLNFLMASIPTSLIKASTVEKRILLMVGRSSTFKHLVSFQVEVDAFWGVFVDPFLRLWLDIVLANVTGMDEFIRHFPGLFIALIDFIYEGLHTTAKYNCSSGFQSD